MSKNIFEELPSRKGTSAEARPQPKGGSAERGGSTMGASNVEQGADPKQKQKSEFARLFMIFVIVQGERMLRLGKHCLSICKIAN